MEAMGEQLHNVLRKWLLRQEGCPQDLVWALDDMCALLDYAHLMERGKLHPELMECAGLEVAECARYIKLFGGEYYVGGGDVREFDNGVKWGELTSSVPIGIMRE
jgi:hypothetical protein